SALSVTEGFLQPHPCSTAISTIFDAVMGMTLLFCTILAIPSVILAGPAEARFLIGSDKPIPEGMYCANSFSD
ncbi:gluconate transporter, partial [Salmonella enterica subsp. enterica serovar Typhimurium]